MSTVPPVDKAMLAQTEDMLLTSEYLTDLLSRHSISPMEWYFMSQLMKKISTKVNTINDFVQEQRPEQMLM
jgi:hypothetical protein